VDARRVVGDGPALGRDDQVDAGDHRAGVHVDQAGGDLDDVGLLRRLAGRVPVG